MHSSAADPADDKGVLRDRPVGRFRNVLTFSVFFGLLAGLGEGLIDLTVRHYHAPAVLYVTVGANLAIFLIVGLLFWVLGFGLKPQLASFLVLFALSWVLLHGWNSEFTQDTQRAHNLLWLVSLITTCLVAALLSRWASKHEQELAAILGRTLPWISGTALVCLIAAQFLRMETRHRAGLTAQMPAQGAPNIVLVIVDTLRADHLSSYHYPRLTSPHIDEMAAKGALFENAISTSSWTLPSHASMLTGLYPAQHGAQAIQDQLGANIPTIAEALSRAGYHTAAYSASPFFTRQQGLGRGFMEFGDFFLSPTVALNQVHYTSTIINDLSKKGWIRSVGWSSAVTVNASVSQWLDRTNGPFFLALNYFEVHEPNMVPREWHGRYAAEQRSEKRIANETTRAVPQGALQIQQKIDDYDDAIAYVDDCLQQLMSNLAHRSLTNNILVIFTSDHGEGLGEHGEVGHGTTLYYPTVHVPLIFYWPGHIPAGIRINQAISTKELPATILDLLGIPHVQLPGNSLAAFWRSPSPNEWPLPVSELLPDRLIYGRSFGRDDAIESIISPDFQLIIDPRGGTSLYNWRIDPQELDNLTYSSSYERISAELTTELKLAH